MVNLGSKRQLYTIVAVVFILIIAAYLIIRSSSGDQKALENAALANYLTFNKCVSLSVLQKPLILLCRKSK